MLPLSNAVKPAAIAIAGLVLMLTAISVQRGVAAAQDVPRESVVTYKLAAGASLVINSPAYNKSIWVMGCNTTSGDRGVGHVALQSVEGNFLEWTGLNSAYNGTITSGFSASAGTHIVQIDYDGYVNINVASDNSFEVTNSTGGTEAGFVTMMW
jgi:hypothetical protein